MTAGLVARDLVVGFGGRRRRLRENDAFRAVLGPVSIAAAPGTVTALIGPNGAGKSTLLRALTGVTRPLAGLVLIDDHPLMSLSHAERARHVAAVMTDRGALGGLTSYEVVGLGRHPHTGWSGRMDDADHAIVAEAIERVGAAALASRRVDELSDGERQRVAIARALAQQAAVLVLDEPTAFLDVTGRVRTMQLLSELTSTAAIAVIIATHDLELTLPIVDRVWCVTEGTLHDGTLAELDRAGLLSAAFDTPITHDAASDSVRISVRR